MTRTFPFLLMILQFRQIFLTDARTFMGLILYHLKRYVMRPLVKS